MVVDTWIWPCQFPRSFSGAPGGDRGGALAQHAGNFGAIDNGAALVVDRTAGGTAGGGRSFQRRIVECEPISASAAASTSSTVGATAPSPTRAAVQTPSFSVRLTPTANDSDVHFRARNHAQIGVAGTRRPRRQLETDEDFAGLQVGAARTGRHLFHLHLAAAVRPLHGDDGTGRDHRAARCRRPASHCRDYRRRRPAPGPAWNRSG